ncbi:selenoprotein K-like isoform X2 [Carex littledalei]|uniref:Selenoprotein K-like isoform X2 n=1 Tax=Carex littledalei TaxID=544730 RepID=A0A833VM99_9POAL|nr:selenoprotein K-like isoform X2 [Carex littledalei]
MAYVERGVMKSKRSIWRLSIISDFFLGIYNFIKLFFLTMFSMDKSEEYKKGSGAGKKWDGGPGGGPGGNGRGPYGGGGGGGGSRGPRTLSDLRSNDHSSLPACGSCCG